MGAPTDSSRLPIDGERGMTQSMKTIGLAVLGGCAALALAAGPAAPTR